MKLLIPLALVLTLLVPASAMSQGVEALEVTFVVNDAFVKDRLLEGAAISIANSSGGEAITQGITDSEGRWTTELPAGTWFVSYKLSGYVPIGSSETPIHTDKQIITTTLSMLLEAEGGEFARRIRVVLNWGSDESQVRDADSHILCPCGQPASHVYFSSKDHVHDDGLAINLDVDDTDWGGPETITINDPEPGHYEYWVHNYSGEPARLGASDVVIRVFFDDEIAGEYRVPPDVSNENWRPFKALVVESDFRPRILPFTDEELAAALDRQQVKLPLPPTQPPGQRGSSGFTWSHFVAFAIISIFFIRMVRRRR